MKLEIVTIVLDGRPFINWHLPIFTSLPCVWHWTVVHGAAMNNGSTGWCTAQKPRLSVDGTTEYLASLRGDPNVTVLESECWESKDAMMNAALQRIKSPSILVQIDHDEVHSTEGLRTIIQLFQDDPQLGAIRMPCRFFVGPRLICVGEDCWSSRWFEWDRAWRFAPGIQFTSHEPPRVNYYLGRIMKREESKEHGLSFDHYAYALRKQVEYKEKFYGYKGLTNQWKSLQAHIHFPEPLQRFFPFVDDKVMVDRL